MRCGICSSEQRSAIERAVDGGASLEAVAEQYRLSERALAKHMASHPREVPKPRAKPLPRKMPPTAEAKPRRSSTMRPPARALSSPPVRPTLPPPPPLPSGLDVQEHDDEPPITSRSPVQLTSARAALDVLRRDVHDLLVQAKHADVAFADKDRALRTALQSIRLLATMTGELGASESTVASSPFYRRVRTAVVDALRPHPEAAKAVIDALERVERGSADMEAAAE